LLFEVKFDLEILGAIFFDGATLLRVQLSQYAQTFLERKWKILKHNHVWEG